MKLGELRTLFKGLPSDIEVVFVDSDGRDLDMNLRYHEPTPLEPYGKAVFAFKKEFVKSEVVEGE